MENRKIRYPKIRNVSEGANNIKRITVPFYATALYAASLVRSSIRSVRYELGEALQRRSKWVGADMLDYLNSNGVLSVQLEGMDADIEPILKGLGYNRVTINNMLGSSEFYDYRTLIEPDSKKQDYVVLPAGAFKPEIRTVNTVTLEVMHRDYIVVNKKDAIKYSKDGEIKQLIKELIKSNNCNRIALFDDMINESTSLYESDDAPNKLIKVEVPFYSFMIYLNSYINNDLYSFKSNKLEDILQARHKFVNANVLRVPNDDTLVVELEGTVYDINNVLVGMQYPQQFIDTLISSDKFLTTEEFYQIDKRNYNSVVVPSEMVEKVPHVNVNEILVDGRSFTIVPLSDINKCIKEGLGKKILLRDLLSAKNENKIALLLDAINENMKNRKMSSRNRRPNRGSTINPIVSGGKEIYRVSESENYEDYTSELVTVPVSLSDLLIFLHTTIRVRGDEVGGELEYVDNKYKIELERALFMILGMERLVSVTKNTAGYWFANVRGLADEVLPFLYNFYQPSVARDVVNGKYGSSTPTLRGSLGLREKLITHWIVVPIEMICDDIHYKITTCEVPNIGELAIIELEIADEVVKEGKAKEVMLDLIDSGQTDNINALLEAVKTVNEDKFYNHGGININENKHISSVERNVYMNKLRKKRSLNESLNDNIQNNNRIDPVKAKERYYNDVLTSPFAVSGELVAEAMRYNNSKRVIQICESYKTDAGKINEGLFNGIDYVSEKSLNFAAKQKRRKSLVSATVGDYTADVIYGLTYNGDNVQAVVESVSVTSMSGNGNLNENVIENQLKRALKSKSLRKWNYKLKR
mgnify:CR=1 FL=1